MTVDLKALVRKTVVVNLDNTGVVVALEKTHEGEWELARKSEYKRDIFIIPDADVFLEVCFSRSGTYHSGYTYDKPKFSLVKKTTEDVVSYPAIDALKNQADSLKAEHFDQNDDTQLKPIYTSGWVSEHKINSYESVYDIGGVLLKQTLYGDSDWTEFVEYAIVDKHEETVVSYKKN